MGEREQAADLDGHDDGFEPVIGDYDGDDFEPLEAFSSRKQRLAAMRRRAERRLEEKRLREELGDYDLELDDY
ncbi:MAG: PA3496 family putative envelope integrity protein [Pseudohaliea sp.]